ncbi:MAG: glycosyltransferase family 2 protein [Proteobacteria bacterium]|nr:glycosyltransferase family 2 protein [Pseudomonadota bacterium]
MTQRNEKVITPKVSIGMPVYNGEKFIREALDSLLAQTFTDFEIIISDNASTDGTSEICSEYISRDSRIRYIRQTENIGIMRNFQFVLDEAIGEYFMWAAHDDLWGTKFIEENEIFLDDHGDYIASISATIDYRGLTSKEVGSLIIDDDTSEGRIRRIYKNQYGNAKFYSLFKRNLIADINLSDFNYIAGDWSVMIVFAKRGKFNSFDREIGFTKRAGLGSSLVKYLDYFRLNKIEYFFPFYYYSIFILKETKSFKKRTNIILYLLLLNLYIATVYCLAHFKWPYRIAFFRRKFGYPG